jgi:hypothetical protein
MGLHALGEGRNTQGAAGGALKVIAENRFADVVATQSVILFKDHFIAKQTMSTGLASGCDARRTDTGG